ncbi:putative immune-type receptor 12b precursor, partial [Clarias magur]
LLSETLCSSLEAGDNVTIWCEFDESLANTIFWFKHTSDSVPLLIGCKKFRASGPSETCKSFTENERIVMNVYKKNTSLTITAVNVSDSGLYYCGYGEERISPKLSNSTSLHVKDNNKQNSVDKMSGTNDCENKTTGTNINLFENKTT